MIIVLNGSFGVGKSSTAEGLLAALPNAMIFDPEIVGQMVRFITLNVRKGHEDTDDFQDIAMWRTMTVLTAEQLYAQYHRDLIIPMTIAAPNYFKEITDGLRAIGPDFHHFCLIASIPTIERRLAGRGDHGNAWLVTRVERYVPQFEKPLYSKHINTDDLSIQAVVNTILGHLPLQSL